MALHKAAAQPALSAVAALLSTGVSADDRDDTGSTALQSAIQGSSEHLKVAQLLLEHGANPNAVDAMQETPLHVSVAYDMTSFVSLLLKHGADIAAESALGWSAIATATRLGHTNSLKLMCDHADGSSRTLAALAAAAGVAARGRHWQCLAVLLKAGGRLAGPGWVHARVSELGAADVSTACTELVHAWLQDTSFIHLQWQKLRRQQQDCASIGLGLRRLLLSSLAARKQQCEEQQ